MSYPCASHNSIRRAGHVDLHPASHGVKITSKAENFCALSRYCKRTGASAVADRACRRPEHRINRTLGADSVETLLLVRNLDRGRFRSVYRALRPALYRL